MDPGDIKHLFIFSQMIYMVGIINSMWTSYNSDRIDILEKIISDMQKIHPEIVIRAAPAA